jgi:hypothetical protein
MAYGLRYTLTQELRNENLQVVKIYQKDYSGSVKTYEPTSIILQPNSNDEDPIGGIISSQLNVSFIISTESDYTNFPDLLNFDDTKYYVELVINNVITWKGFLFNDYINLAFTTGNQEVNIVCVDGLSLIKYNNYDTDLSINTRITLLKLIGTCLSNIPFNTASNLYACCSYYAEGMLDRADGGQYEPFAQSTIFIRDVINIDYYTILENIVTTFGCRLFQANGDWYILPMNQMASTIYYTKYTISTNPTVVASGTLTNTINIAPYQDGNVHFVNNGQTKIVRKGYQVVEANSQLTYVDNAINNGTFKKISSGQAIGWQKSEVSTGTVTLVEQSDAEFNYYIISRGDSFFGSAALTNVVSSFTKQNFAPYMYGPGATLSFDYEGYQVGDKIKLIVELYRKTAVSYDSNYLTNDFKWSETVSAIEIVADKEQQFEAKTINIPLGQVANDSPFLLAGYSGHIIITFLADSAAYKGGKIRNIKLNQQDYSITALDVKRQIGQDNVIVKEIELPYGLYSPPYGGWNGGNNNFGALFNLTGVPSSSQLTNGALINWYKYEDIATEYYQLHSLIIRQYSNLLNRNIASLEGDLGNYKATNGLIYLDKTFTVQDSSTNALSYNGKKFLINRLTLDTYNDEVSSIQLIEVTNTDNASVETIKYIGL